MAFIPAAISAIGAAFASGGFFTSVVGRLLLSVAVSALASAVASKPKINTPGIRTDVTQSGGVNPASFVLGRYATAGTAVCPPMTYGVQDLFGRVDTKNEFLVYVIDLGDIPGGSGLEGLFVDGQKVTLGGSAEERGYPGTGIFEDVLWVKFRNGTETEADPYLRRVFGAYPERPWTADMIGRGVPHVILTFKYSRDTYNSYPTCLFVVGGIPLYDPRFDSTAGGSGPQRWDDPSTWQPSENPGVQAYNIWRGIGFEGGFVWGGRAEAGDLPASALFAAMNRADTLIDLTGGGSEPQYRASMEVTVEDEPAAILEELMLGCTGQVAEVGGEWRLRLGAPDLPVYFFEDGDVIVSRDQELDPFPALDRTYNAIHASYPDPASNWEPRDAPPRYNAVWEALDQDRRLVADINLPATPYPDQVQRAQRAYIEGERRFRTHMLTLPPEAEVLEPLDTLSWTSARNGYDGKLFEVQETAIDLMSGLVRVSIREVDPADYAWQSSYQIPVETPSGVVLPPPEYPVYDGDLIAAAVLDASATTRRPALRLVWSPVSAGVVRGLEWEVRLAGGEVFLQGSTQALTSGAVLISESILPATAYEARMRFVADAITPWTEWFAATTQDLRIGAADLATEVTEAISTLEGNAAASLVMRARAGGAVGEVEVVAADDPSGTSSLVVIRSDRFVFAGDLAEFLGDVQIGGDLIAGGAVSRRVFVSAWTSRTISGVGVANAVQLGSSFEFDPAPYVTEGAFTLNPALVTMTMAVSTPVGAGTAAGRLNLDLQSWDEANSVWEFRLGTSVYFYAGGGGSYPTLRLVGSVGHGNIPMNAGTWRIMAYLQTGSPNVSMASFVATIEQVNK
jgi:hypothetical protein